MKSTQNVIHKNISDKKKSLTLTLVDSGQDTLTWWLEQYLSHGVTTSKSSQHSQYKDIIHFIMFMLREEGTEDRHRWTPRLSRAFLDHFKGLINNRTGQPYSSRTISRTLAHLKTFAKWIHKWKRCQAKISNNSEVWRYDRSPEYGKGFNVDIFARAGNQENYSIIGEVKIRDKSVLLCLAPNYVKRSHNRPIIFYGKPGNQTIGVCNFFLSMLYKRLWTTHTKNESATRTCLLAEKRNWLISLNG